jgi:hypothetical protein
MANHIDNAIDSTEIDLGEKSVRGPRSKYFFCINWKSKQYGPVKAETTEEASDAWARAHLNASGDPTPPNVICGGEVLKELGGGSGYYLAKGTGMSDVQRISVTVTAKQMTNFTSTRVKAEFKGWVVYGNGLKGFKVDGVEYKDDELAMIMFEAPIDKSVKIPKPKLKKSEAVRMDDLTIIYE